MIFDLAPPQILAFLPQFVPAGGASGGAFARRDALFIAPGLRLAREPRA